MKEKISIIIILTILLVTPGCLNKKETVNNSEEKNQKYHRLLEISITLSNIDTGFILVPIPIYQDEEKNEHASQLAYNFTAENPEAIIVNTEKGLAFNITINKEDTILGTILEWEDIVVMNFQYSTVISDLSMGADDEYVHSFFIYSNLSSEITLDYLCKKYSSVNENNEELYNDDGVSIWICKNISITKGWQVIEL